MKDLTISNIERQNVLNNRFAVSKVQKHLDIEGILFEGEYRFTKKMVADFYEVEEATGATPVRALQLLNDDEFATNAIVKALPAIISLRNTLRSRFTKTS